jgi:hypothetical protein
LCGVFLTAIAFKFLAGFLGMLGGHRSSVIQTCINMGNNEKDSHLNTLNIQYKFKPIYLSLSISYGLKGSTA